jgi:hypothetical protein
MTAVPKIPPPRSLDIYRLVVARRVKQLKVARLFGVTPSRVSQVVRRVRRWVDDCLGDWLFPRRDDLRFYAALQADQIRVIELPSDPENVDFLAPDWTYSRRVGQAASVADGDNTSANTPANPATNISAPPLNSPPNPDFDSCAATANGPIDCIPAHVHELAFRLAQLLTIWKKSRTLTSAFKQPRETP